jgi:ribosomal protein S27E
MPHKYVKFKTEVVTGQCPTCGQNAVLVSLASDHFRCTTCGSDLKQYINGKISYLPVLTSSDKLQSL